MLTLIIFWLGGAVIFLPIASIYLYNTDKNRFSKNWPWVILFSLYINALFNVVGIPDIAYIKWEPSVNWIPFTDLSLSNVTGMLMNILLFVPFGGFITVYFNKFKKWKMLILAGFVLSILIEIMQLFTFRATDVDDLIMNTTGTIIGGIIAKRFFKKSSSEIEDKDVIKLFIMVLLMLIIHFVFNSFLNNVILY